MIVMSGVPAVTWRIMRTRRRTVMIMIPWRAAVMVISRYRPVIVVEVHVSVPVHNSFHQNPPAAQYVKVPVRIHKRHRGKRILSLITPHIDVGIVGAPAVTVIYDSNIIIGIPPARAARCEK